MPYAVLEQKLRMVNEQDFDFVSHFFGFSFVKPQKSRRRRGATKSRIQCNSV